MRLPVALLFLLLGTSLGNFRVTFPPSRGFSPTSNTNAPCGGYNTVGSRTTWSVPESEYYTVSFQPTLLPNTTAKITAYWDNTSAGSTFSRPLSVKVYNRTLDVSGMGYIGVHDVLFPSSFQFIYTDENGTSFYQCADVSIWGGAVVLALGVGNLIVGFLFVTSCVL